MSSISVTTTDGQERTLSAMPGLSVMEIIRDGGVDELQALCGGCLSCATCHVYVDESFQGLMPKMSQEENELLDSSNARQPNSRLSCQLRYDASWDGLKVVVAPEAW